jgi:chorismate dehydratase
MSKIKVSVVSYLNSKVFLKGLTDKHQSTFEIFEDIPSVCAQKLMNDLVDIGLVPVAIIPEIKNAHVISNYCISADGAVNSVFLLSNTELENIKTIYLDTHSRTSNLLCKILVNEHWKLDVRFIEQMDEHHVIKEHEAYVLIGDRTFSKIGKYHTELDLAKHWKDFTGLPFVFAAWVANKSISKEQEQLFNAYLEDGIAKLDEVIRENALNYFDVSDYLKSKIEYQLSEQKLTALKLYLEKSMLYR